ncbi:MAG TPA: radical SAM protein, partial [Candidatus Goldiibacteriota bacterium]|nr:radical SAM protein [Candidatus Goldiibacteriota bacterium]
MRALLINPWIYDFKCHDFWIKPHGFLRIASMLKNNGFAIDFIDCMDRFDPDMKDYKIKDDEYGKGKFFYEEIEKPDVYSKIPRKYKRYGTLVSIFKNKLEKLQKPDVILITSSMTYNYEGVFYAIDLLKEKFENVKIVLGGIYATLCNDHAKKRSKADFVWKGRVNDTFFKLLKHYTGKDIICDENINEVLPDYSFYKNVPYAAVRFTFGCPFNCTYCAVKSFNDDYYQRDVQNIIYELKKYYESGISDVAFYDDALLYKNFYVKSILRKIIKEKLKFHFHTPNGLHASYVDADMAELLKESGFVDLRIS